MTETSLESEAGAALAPGLLAGVLRFLGVERAAPDRALLDRLIEAYTRRVPWESATRIARTAWAAAAARAVGPDPESHGEQPGSDRFADAAGSGSRAPVEPYWPEQFWQEAMTRGSGGTCFESNLAFFALLRALGYAGYLTINDMGETRGCHTASVVTLGAERWLVDVGIPLYAALRLDPAAPTERGGRFHTYRAQPLGDGRYAIRRDRHPHPEIYTLIDRPVPLAEYRAATARDYGPGGLFLDRVVVAKVIEGRQWRFDGADRPFHMDSFLDGANVEHPIAGEPAAAVAARFGMDAAVLRTALAATGALST